MRRTSQLRTALLQRLLPTLIAVLWGLGAPLTSHAWGFELHRLVASMAETQLSPTASREVRRLLALEPGATLPSIATWADLNRTPTTAPWHFVNIPPEDSCTYVASRSCPFSNCVVTAIDQQAAILKSNGTDADRLLALKYLVHLVADAHQPLHAGRASDKGGNTFQLQAFGRGSNLHELWDVGLAENRAGGVALLKEGMPFSGAPAREVLDPVTWVEESCRVMSAAGFYPQDRTVGTDYGDEWDAQLRARLLAASRRTAAAINGAFEGR